MRRLSIPAGSLLGAKLRVSPFLLLMLLLAWRLGVFPYYVMLFALVLGHELAHGLAARLSGVEVEEIELTPFGGVARVGAELEMMPLREIAIALAGPAFNVLMVLIAAFLDRVVFLDPQGFSAFIGANLLLAGFNLLPALPLDGGRVLRAALSLPLGLNAATKIASGIGCAAGIALLGFGVWGAFHGQMNLTYIICGAMLALMALREGRSAASLYLRDITARDRTLGKCGALPVRVIAMPPGTTVARAIRRLKPHSYHRVLVVDNALSERGELTEGELVGQMLSGNAARTLGEVIE